MDQSVDSPAEDATRSPLGFHGRKRAKRACTTCRGLKRKCDGHQPCSMCVQYEYECRFETKRPRTMSDHRNGAFDGEKSLFARADGPHQHDESAKANASVNFPQTLSSRINPQAPKLHSYAWNVGVRNTNDLCLPDRVPGSFRDFISVNQVDEFIDVYFSSIHAVYNFLDLDCDRAKKQLGHRLSQPDNEADIAQDAVFCGMLALGMLFSGKDHEDDERWLVSYAYWILGTTSMLQSPTAQDVEAWLLRCYYLRCAGSPHAGWIASSTTMQLIEAAGLHLEPDPDDPRAEHNRKLYWMTKVLNMWISFDLGLRHTEPRGSTCLPPSRTSVPNQHSRYADLIALYEISRQLDPDAVEPARLEEVLNQVIAIQPQHDMIVLSRTNVILMIFRRLFLASPILPRDLSRRIISSLEAGLDAAARLGEAKQPWWHVANVPFQFVCVILAIDTSESLSYIWRAMTTLHSLTKMFNTPVMLKAAETADQLVRMSQQRKQEESAYLLQGINASTLVSSEPVAHANALIDANLQENAATFGETDYGDLPPFNANFDWNSFLGLGAPVFT